ncbi:MAG: L-2-amino-thiazoline-4-carboxylic acid hydrolase [Desulforhabdus sp.]|jgi:hypothetical protein|nr:L-2-amino-thiazoline-4-carboxylic acid hydrolase [Desulforhabdus sp.]
MAEQNLRELLYAQIKNRGMMYYYIFKELREEVGEKRAVEIMKRAIYKRGLEVGKALARYAPDDLEGLKNAFLTRVVPDDDKMFAPEVLRCDKEELEIKLRQCPLKDAYREAGLSEEEMATMLGIAAQVDYGTFEGAGFAFSAETWQPGKKGCCHLHIRPKN